MEVVDSTQYGDFFLLALYTGARRSELCGLRWPNVDLASGVIRIVQTRQIIDGIEVIAAPKTMRSRRSVVLDESAVDLMHTVRGRQIADAVRLGSDWNPDGYVFTQFNGKPAHPSEVSRAFRSLVVENHLPPLTLHGLRHVHATRLLQRGVHPKIVSERLGHATIAITLDTYSHVIPGLQESAIRSLGPIFG